MKYQVAKKVRNLYSNNELKKNKHKNNTIRLEKNTIKQTREMLDDNNSAITKNRGSFVSKAVLFNLLMQESYIAIHF
jgi:low affinity Fe/Cu permease